VTPEIAKAWLEHNSLNRSLRDRVVAKYAADMKAGRWKTTHQGVAIYADGDLADGQHRLKAIISSGAAVPMLVTFGLDKSNGSGLDQHAPRLAHDAIRIGSGEHWIDKDVVAVSRSLMDRLGGENSCQISTQQIMDFAIKHKPQILFALSLIARKRKALTSSGIVACYVCAFMAGEKAEMLRRFANIMATGEIEGPHENAAIRLREYLINTTGVWVSSERTHTGRRAQRAIQAFCAMQPLAKLYEPDDFLYPFPE
jgi:hypothetical protein